MKPFEQFRIAFVAFSLAMSGGRLLAQTAALDFGDAPAPYPTLLVDNGARHIISSRIFLGKTIDAESNGQPNASATGDDISSKLNDEDGVVFASAQPFKARTVVNLTVTASVSGFLDAWVDFNLNGSWADAEDKIFNSLQLAAGANQLQFTVPQDALTGQSYARFRFSTKGGLTFTGQASDGEVEDYAVTLQAEALDYGDAPKNYPVTLAQNGARHRALEGFQLGSRIDTELDGQPSSKADADDSSPAGVVSDEDGVKFPDPFTAGEKGRIEVIPSSAGIIDAWLDFNANGSWDDKGDKIADSVQVKAGSNFIDFEIPSSAAIGNTFLRVRLSRKGGLLPTGLAPDGEVEDYLVTILKAPPTMDFGDAPQNYPVTLAQDGARHVISPNGPFLGSTVDAEYDGQPSTGADGDDNVSVNGADDEDGVSFTSPIRSGTANVDVTVVGQGKLDAWLDFNGNGSWDDVGEQIFTSIGVVSGINHLTFTVPANALVGTTFARFRLSSEGGLKPTGLATEGEVEDYAVSVQKALPTLDFGDAPQNYPVTLKQDGARHVISPNGPFLGSTVDAEDDGQPSAAADGDDKNPPNGVGDEDGVVISNAAAGSTLNFDVTVTGQGKLDAWIDFNVNGSWEDAGEQVLASVAVVSGVNHLSVAIPSNATVGTTFARFRISRAGGLKSTGLAPDGEVEDYPITITKLVPTLDFGDAPQNYPVTLKQDGARHQINRDGPFLGTVVDAELDGQPSSLADGDDNNPAATGPDDEDGVTIPALSRGSSATIDVFVTGQGKLDAWIDFNANGSWEDAGDQVISSVAVVPGINHLSVEVPSSAIVGTTFARFRISRAGGLKSTGLAPDGEVEDYLVTIADAQQFDFGDAPQNYPVTLAQDGARHLIIKGFNLGHFIDAEKDGQPSSLADGDDKNPPSGTFAIPDDEDGITFLTDPLIPGATALVQVVVTGEGGHLDAWVDFNINGSWNDDLEQIFRVVSVTPGTNTLTFTVPENATTGGSFARFRLSRKGGLKPTGAAPDGEVEDYSIRIGQAAGNLDFGDAPQNYPVTLAQNGARHQILKGLSLGRLIDAEPDGQPSSLADGDDKNPPNSASDEDGVKFVTNPLVPGDIGVVQVTVIGEGHLDAWIDFNKDGDWNDANEQIFQSISLSTGTHTLRFPVPNDALPGATFARFRLSREGKLSPVGPAPDGEVEDYMVNVSRGEPGCDTRTHRGTDFWLTFPGNYAPDPDNTNKLTLSITGPPGNAGKVEIPGLGFSVNFSIPASAQTVVVLPKAADLGDANDIIEDKGIHVTAKNEVAVYALNFVKYTTDGYLGLPSDVIGQRYVIASYMNVFTNAPDLNGSQFAIVATADDTTVAILPRVDTGDHPAGTVYAINLNQGQTYQLRNTNGYPNDLSGTLVFADKPISVFGSHECTAIPDDSKLFCNYLVEQLVPIERAGNRFETMPFRTRSSSTIRVQAFLNGTLVLVGGIPVATLSAGEIHQQMVTGPAEILTSKPVLVTQYSNSSDYDGVQNSDPFMINVLSVGQYLNKYEVASPSSGFGGNYIGVVTPNSNIGSLTIDGVSVSPGSFTPIPGTSFSGVQLGVSTGLHNLAAPAPFGVTAYAYGQYDGYGYPGGMFFGDTMPPTVSYPQDAITNVVGPNVAGASGCTVPIPDLRGKTVVRDNCGLPERSTVSQTPAPGTLVGPGQYLIYLLALDASGNVGFDVVQFVVVDPSPIEIVCPKDITVLKCDAPGGAHVVFRVNAHRQCETDIPVDCDPPSGSLFPEGVTPVHCQVVDTDGTVVSCSFNVTVKCDGSTQPPISITQVDKTHVGIAWNTGQQLETADSIEGPWTHVDTTDNSYTAETKSKKSFYRIR